MAPEVIDLTLSSDDEPSVAPDIVRIDLWSSSDNEDTITVAQATMERPTRHSPMPDHHDVAQPAFHFARDARMPAQPRRAAAASSGVLKKAGTTDDVNDIRTPSRPRRAAAARSVGVTKRSRENGSAESSDDVFRQQPAAKKKKVAARRHDSDVAMEDNSGNETVLKPKQTAKRTKKQTEKPAGRQSKQPIESDTDPAKNETVMATTSHTVSAKTGASNKGQKGSTKRVKSLLARGKNQTPGLDLSLPPMFKIDDIFLDLTKNALKLGLDETIKTLVGRRIRVATMCSGTESPLLAIEEIRDALSGLGHRNFDIEHMFSAEIVPYKQAYIERNFHPPIIFRDITELTEMVQQENPMATTAYGARVAVPTDIDILIAGTSCVDFSSKNAKKKGLKGGGESDLTFHAFLAYCKAYQPSIVLLENVKGAHWDQMMAAFEEASFAVACVHVASKDYYLPQTRQRGYMACFSTKNGRRAAEAAVLQWSKLMGQLKRHASSPVSAFLLPSDQIVNRDLRADETGRIVDWSQCEITQREYRRTRSLGNGRPFTQWTESGFTNPPDHAHAPSINKKVEREKDCIDVSLLRKALPRNDPEVVKSIKKGNREAGSYLEVGAYDVRYKARYIDISQNLRYGEDETQTGIVICITPDHKLFATDPCRFLGGEETLKLQGIPLNRISFTTETDDNMKDLAGNAMSSPVIGSSILAALVAGKELLHTTVPPVPPSKGVNKSRPMEWLTSQRSPITEETDECDPRPRTSQLFTTSKLRELRSQAEQARRRCYCEGSHGTSNSPIQECSDCGETTCTSCGGNPRHNYQPLPLGERLAPSEFEDCARSVLPLQLSLSWADLADMLHLPRDYREALQKAVKTVFSFQHIRRTYCWTATWHAPSQARIDLVLEDYGQAEWRLYAQPDKHLPSVDPLRSQLEQPVLRATVNDHGMRWQMRQPKDSPISVIVRGSGDQVLSWWSRIGLPQFREHWIWEYLDIDIDNAAGEVSTLLSGKYQYLPRCGTACEGLYKQISHDRVSHGRAPIYLFLDPGAISPSSEDCFVFSQNRARLEYGEVRPYIARIEAPWRPWLFGEELPQVRQALLRLDDWTDVPSCSLRAENLSHRVIDQTADLSLESATCSQFASVVSCTVPNSVLTTPDRLTDDCFLEANAWIFEAMRKDPKERPSDQWRPLANSLADADCQSCAPTPPKLRWRRTTSGGVEPFEDPASAAGYERAIKARAEPIAARITAAAATTVTLGVNVTSLAHRARKWLPETDVQGLRFDWRFESNANRRSTFRFKPFRLSKTAGKADSSAQSLKMKLELFPKQQLALAWMKQQELGCVFDLEAVTEAAMEHIDVRTEVRARATITVHGGLCAHHPAFGKTILSLALIQSELQGKDVLAELERTQNKNPSWLGFIAVRATLIVCPMSLVAQWIKEIKEKLGMTTPGDVIAIKTTADLNKYTIYNFKQAKIVVLSQAVLVADPYVDRLAAFSAMPGPITTSGRAYSSWLDRAAKGLSKHVGFLQDHGIARTKQHLQKVYQANLDSKEFEAFIPSKRLRGKEYAQSKSELKSETVSEEQDAPKTLNTEFVDKPLLDMFFFNRLIVDEIHGIHPKQYASIVALKAWKRWGLSGTPAMADFYEVAAMAKLLGIDLPIGPLARPIMKASSVTRAKKDMTKFELFDAGRGRMSDTLLSYAHQLHQSFLGAFVRQDSMDNANLTTHEHLIPVRLDAEHLTWYKELAYQYNSRRMQLAKGNKANAADRDQRLTEASESSSTAEEALSKTAAFSDCSKSESFDRQIAQREERARKIRKQLPASIAIAQRKSPDEMLSLKEDLRKAEAPFGDYDTAQLILGIMDGKASTDESSEMDPASEAEEEAEAETKKGKKGKKGKEAKDTPKEKKKPTEIAKLNQQCKRLFVENTSARAMQSVQTLLQANAEDSPNHFRCDDPSCRAETAPGNAAVSMFCGHTICDPCWRRHQDGIYLQCPATGCAYLLETQQLLWANKLNGTDAAQSEAPYGAKLRRAISILQDIKSQGEQAILFVQFAEQIAEVEEALERTSIRARIVKSAGDADTQMEDFRESATSKKPITVIVLNASAETAAGSNLQNANHVIYLSPLLRETQYGYDSTMAQTLGRVKRFGQKKEIHVYRIVALDTIDVDILQHREKRVSALTELGKPSMPNHGLVEVDADGEEVREKTRLVCEDGVFSLRPLSWFVAEEGKSGFADWEDFSSRVQFSQAYTDDD